MRTLDASPPAAASGGDHHATTVILHAVVDSTVTFTEKLSHLADAHVDTEPAISLRVLALNHEIIRAVLRWIDQWPPSGEEVGS